MGIYISRMKMPNPGQIVLVEIDENDNVFAAYDGGRTKLAQYTAIPVPPHGKLIDADMLPISTAVPLDGKPYRYVHIDNIESVPPIIPAEEG